MNHLKLYINTKGIEWIGEIDRKMKFDKTRKVPESIQK